MPQNSMISSSAFSNQKSVVNALSHAFPTPVLDLLYFPKVHKSGLVLIAVPDIFMSPLLIRCAFLSCHAVVEGRTVPPHRLVGIRSHIECLQTAAQCMLLEVMSLQCKENSEGLKRSHERAM